MLSSEEATPRCFPAGVTGCHTKVVRFLYCTVTGGRFRPTLANRSRIRRVVSSCRLIWIFVYSSVILTVLADSGEGEH